MHSKTILLTHQEYKEPIIGRWAKLKDYDIMGVDISTEMMGINLILLITEDEEMIRFVREQHHKVEDRMDKNGAYYQLTDPKTLKMHHYIQLKSYDITLFNTINTAAHEIHHFVHGVLRDKGIEYGEGGEELYAYMQGHFTEMVARALSQLYKLKMKKKHRRTTKHPKKKRKWAPQQ